jgi:PHD/YefM family antitoxin component YafN of YafNO toxin-antitoxin module
MKSEARIAPLKVLSYRKGVIMLDITKDIQPLTTFRRKPSEFLRHLKTSKRPIVQTLNGKAEAVVQDAEAYQHLLDIAARADVFEAIRQGLDDVAGGRTRPAREVFDEIRQKRGIRR